MVAIGYILETVFFETCAVILFAISLAELWCDLKPENRPKVKVLQKYITPGCIIFSFYALFMFIDHRRVYGIYTHSAFTPEVMITLCLFGLLPMFWFGGLWFQQMYSTTYRMLGKKDLVFTSRLLFAINFSLAVDVLGTCIFLILKQQTRYLAVLFLHIILLCVFCSWATWKCLHLILEIEVNDSLSQGVAARKSQQIEMEVVPPSSPTTSSQKNQERPSAPLSAAEEQVARRQRTREVMLYKLKAGFRLTIWLEVVMTSGFIYGFTPKGWNETLHDIMASDPNNYSFGGVLFIGMIAAFTFLGTCIIVLGLFLGKKSEEDHQAGTVNSNSIQPKASSG